MDKKKLIDWRIICVALICITVLECYALSQGIDGLIFTGVIAIIAACMGIVIPSPIKTT